MKLRQWKVFSPSGCRKGNVQIKFNCIVLYVLYDIIKYVIERNA